jgi:histidine triad (HIT) family protein
VKEERMEACLFCKIAAGELDAAIVAESDRALAFRDINPAAPTHVLVIPREHLGSVNDVGRDQAELLQDLFALVVDVAAAEGLSDGYRLVSNIGRAGGQTVGHLHFHVLGGRDMGWPPG